MSDDGTDTFFGVVGGLVVLVGLAMGGGGAAPTAPSGAPSPTPTSFTSAGTGQRPTTTTTRATNSTSTNIPGGPLMVCTGTVIEQKTRTTSSGTMTVQVYYSPINGGRNCAVATTGGNVFSGQRGTVKINLHFTSYEGKRWPRYARHTSASNATRSGSVYLDNTDNRCVRSTASFRPSTGGKIVIVTSGRTGCG